MELLIILLVFAVGVIAIAAIVLGGAAFIFQSIGKLMRKLTDKKS